MADALREAIDLIATMIAEKVAEQIGGAPPEVTVPAPTTDSAPDEESSEDEEEEAAASETADLVSEAYRAFVADEVAAADHDKRVSDLQDFYVDVLGQPKKDIISTLKAMDESEVEESYTDYLARLVKQSGKGDLAYIDSYDDPYQAVRLDDGEEKLRWCLAGKTLTDEEVEEKGLNKKSEPAKGPPKKAGNLKRKK
jgi:hypothetical protein